MKIRNYPEENFRNNWSEVMRNYKQRKDLHLEGDIK